MTTNQDIASLTTGPQTASFGGMLSRVTALLRGVTRPQARSLRCVETLQLGPKRALYLVECDGQRFLAGAGHDGVNTLLPLHANTSRHGSADQGDAA